MFVREPLFCGWFLYANDPGRGVSTTSGFHKAEPTEEQRLAFANDRGFHPLQVTVVGPLMISAPWIGKHVSDEN